MAVCPKPSCNSTRFKIEHIKLENADYPLPVVVCSTCGTAIAVSPEQVLNMLLELNKKL